MEKDYAPKKSESKKMIVETNKNIPEAKAPVEKPINEKLNNEQSGSETSEIKKDEKKQPIIKKPVVKKTEAVVNLRNLPISTKHSMAICDFIKGKKINDCIEYLEKVVVGKKAMPMKGEIPHRKGKMMSGRFPKKASENFIILLKSLRANANANNLEEPIIYEAVANIGNRPFGRFGRTRKKRAHVTIKCREEHSLKKNPRQENELKENKEKKK